jgi:hypothetical protein
MVSRLLPPLAELHGELQPLQIHVLHPQPQKFGQPQPRRVHEFRHQAADPLHRREQSLALLLRQYRRHLPPPARPREIAEITRIALQHLAEEENHGIQSLALRGDGDAFFHGQTGKPLSHIAMVQAVYRLSAD